jgi:hypothetical protein
VINDYEVYNKKGELIAVNIEWCIDDVLYTAKEEGVRLTRKQASEVLSSLLHDHDASIGVNWDTIRETIRMVKEDR